MAEFDTARFAVRFCEAMQAARKFQAVVPHALTVAEESGEMVGSVRRYLGLARRPGSLEEMAAEMADVEISAYVHAVLLGDLHRLELWLSNLDTSMYARYSDAERSALLVHAAAGELSTYMAVGGASALQIRNALAAIILRNRLLAQTLGVDLPAAIEAKAAVIMTRGFGVQREVSRG